MQVSGARSAGGLDCILQITPGDTLACSIQGSARDGNVFSVLVGKHAGRRRGGDRGSCCLRAVALVAAGEDQQSERHLRVSRRSGIASGPTECGDVLQSVSIRPATGQVHERFERREQQRGLRMRSEPAGGRAASAGARSQSHLQLSDGPGTAGRVAECPDLLHEQRVASGGLEHRHQRGRIQDRDVPVHPTGDLNCRGGSDNATEALQSACRPPARLAVNGRPLDVAPVARRSRVEGDANRCRDYAGRRAIERLRRLRANQGQSRRACPQRQRRAEVQERPRRSLRRTQETAHAHDSDPGCRRSRDRRGPPGLCLSRLECADGAGFRRDHRQLYRPDDVVLDPRNCRRRRGCPGCRVRQTAIECRQQRSRRAEPAGKEPA